MPQMSQVLRERAIGMLTAGMSTRAVARELNVHFSTISRLQRRFREFGSTSNRPHNRRPCITTQAQDLHIQHLHLQDRLRPATRTAAATIGLHNQIISAQTVSSQLRHDLRHLFRSGGPRPVFLSMSVLRGLQSAHPPSPVGLLRVGHAFRGGGELCQGSVVCVMCSHLLCPYLVCFRSSSDVIIS